MDKSKHKDGNQVPWTVESVYLAIRVSNTNKLTVWFSSLAQRHGLYKPLQLLLNCDLYLPSPDFQLTVPFL
ncbi:hypothetical protein LWI29_013733 [Acer saccharum]|uniref:Uncharacterized protein n=1 Tax=Acer saccharum TaxID=4024 RepID=A0AA39TED8_ACESA|nr:hypothetical protein LWI29_013733 [Acer saccharum]KAK1582209.1 hypothetical protein Q3G72_012839 [Acer saccharum]KAK1587710.1 hypothetical protein Q3G72_016083 [Acer saccharum]